MGHTHLELSSAEEGCLPVCRRLALTVFNQILHAVDIALKRNHEGPRRFGFSSSGYVLEVSGDSDVFS